MGLSIRVMSINSVGEVMTLTIKKCTEIDVDSVIKIGVETYFETFKDYCTRAVMDNYLREAFSKGKILREMQNTKSEFHFCYLQDEIVGYIKTNTEDAQTDFRDHDGLEIERIYVRSTYRGRGIGSYLMQFGIQKAREQRKRYVWLGVWEKNQRAIAFYQQHGFQADGTHPFRMGDEIQVDIVMKKYL